ncbi:hypothetical protein AOLI_G00172960 [Acnodon oligacanthus]
MEAVPDQEQLLIFLRKLKEVFDVCDEDADGFIRVEHLVDLGLQFGRGDEEVKKFAKFLDPDAHGRINFKDFCHGVFAIKGCEEILKTALGAPPIDRPPYQTDNGYYYQVMLICEGSEGVGFWVCAVAEVRFVVVGLWMCLSEVMVEV